MPTGYTAGIIDGTITDFKQFATLCMRAFGATIHMKDESLTAEYEKREPSDYHQQEIDKANETIKLAESLSDDEIIEKEKQNLLTSKSYHLEAIEKTKQCLERLQSILPAIEQWQPPTPEHTGIKEFMAKQINETIEWDGKTDYHDKALSDIEKSLLSLDAGKIRVQMIEDAKKDLQYHYKQQKEDIQRCNTSNKWVQDLLDSIN